MERLRRFPRQRMPLLLGGLALLLAFSSAVGISFTPAVRSALLPVRASSSTQSPTHAPTKAPIVTTGPVKVMWGDSTALAGWNAMSGAAGYRVTLIRANDMAIMEQVDVPATQLRFDAQGIWPGNQYVIAVQALDGSKHPGAPIYSGAGQAVPIDRSQYPGFLDTMGLPAGAIDHNLWDQRVYVDGGAAASSDGSFINNQIHGHLETGVISIEQSIATISARPAFDFTGRTGHIHGEMDFHGNVSEWSAILLGPRPLNGNEMWDVDDRGFGVRAMPFLEVFNDSVDAVPHGHLRLVESVAGQSVHQLGTFDVPDYNLLNVRNFVDLYVSTTHVKFVVDGLTLVDTALPVALPFSVGYLTLAAESYPKIDTDRFGHVLPCDVAVTGECNVWHLDNWGFDAPATQAAQPATTENLVPGCTEYGMGLQFDSVCDKIVFAPSDLGPHSTTVNVADASNTRAAYLVFDTYRNFNPGSLQVSLNGSAWTTVPWLSNPNGPGWLHQTSQVELPLASLKTGANTVSFRVTSPTKDNSWLGNPIIEQVRTFAYTPPPLPPEPAPIGTWAASIPGAHP